MMTSMLFPAPVFARRRSAVGMLRKRRRWLPPANIIGLLLLTTLPAFAQSQPAAADPAADRLEQALQRVADSVMDVVDAAGSVVTALLEVPPARQYSEVREACADYQPRRQAFYGDIHVHTRWSLDASTQGTLTTPDEAYRFAKGERVGIQPWIDGVAQRSLQLSRPLDFAMVSDHAELFGEVYLCNTPGEQGYKSWQCRLYRTWHRGAFYLFNATAALRQTRLGFCGEEGELCRQAGGEPWREMQQAADNHYDKTAACEFTTFVGYEWTGAGGATGANLHRNVVFRNAVVPDLPVSYIDGSARYLWESLERDCNGADNACEALTVPHNSNLGAGLIFASDSDGTEPMGAEHYALRHKYEPLVEIMQHKGASECFYQPGVNRDEFCAFESLGDKTMGPNRRQTQPDDGFVREVLTEGLRLQQDGAVNPFEFGFIGSSDTHLGTPGAVAEDRFLGHGGAGVPARKKIPPGLPDFLEYNPGGLAGVWAEENSRDALFDAMQRREAFATSGPRIAPRLFAGWDLPVDMCERSDALALAYRDGVPMGGELKAASVADAVPGFYVSATRDAGHSGVDAGNPLQRIQVVKGWVDAEGNKHQAVYDVAGGANDASVDPASCETRGEGHSQLCSVWRDPDFDPAQSAYYYSRVLENPSCRWSQRICVANGVDCARPETITDGFEPCCAASHKPIIQERAWSSPIWYQPAAARAASLTSE